MKQTINMEFVNQNNRPMNPPKAIRRRFPMWLAVVLALCAVLLIGAAIFKDKLTTIQSVKSDYQAVFLTNGQVYFGKVEFTRHWVVMSDIYYLQLAQDLQPASSSNPNQVPDAVQQQSGGQQQIQLVKLGSELHGPQDEMFIAKDKILFWENMKDDARVLQSIREYQNRN